MFQMETLGRHVIAEMDGCERERLDDSSRIRHLLIEAAREAGATVLADETFDFKNGGVSGFVLLAESHISIHTWPEHGYAAVDIYTCGEHTLPSRACDYLAKWLGATQVRVTSLERGVPGRRGGHEHHLTKTDLKIGYPSLWKLSNSA